MKTVHLIISVLLSTIILFTPNFALAVEQTEPLDIVIDGCTGVPQGHWRDCCVEHDYAYWMGGNFSNRKDADERLRWCVNKVNGPGDIFFEGVRSFGRDFWGGAWKNKSLPTITLEESEMIEAEQLFWQNLGRPKDFDFINLETALFPTLTKADLEKLSKKIEKVKASEEFLSFQKRYFDLVGEGPRFVIPKAD